MAMAADSGGTTLTTPSDREVVLTRVINAPRQLVFEAHTSPEHLPHWMLGPDGWQMTVCDLDLRPGGAYRFAWLRPDGSEMEITGEYREVAPPERLVATEQWSGDWAETLNTTVLTERDGRTTITTTLLFPSRQARDAALQTGMAEGADHGYDRLDTYLHTATDKRDLTLTRVIRAPVEQAWLAWSDPGYVMRWWGPAGFTCPRADLDFREGGMSLVCMRAPAEFGGQDMYNTWTYRRIDPPHLIEFVLRFADEHGTTLDPASIGIPPGVPPEVRHVITFRAAGEGQTEMTITEYGYTTDEARDTSRAGLEQTLDKLVAIWSSGQG